MDKNNNILYNIGTKEISNKIGVINMAKIEALVKELQQTTKASEKTVSEKPKSARELRKMIGTRPAFGRNLVDLYKEGR
jgi:hypothetical protein